jgi:tRNA pseudouridine-54 N-methylase
MSQSVVINIQPMTFSKVSSEDIEWFEEHGYSDVVSRLRADDLALSHKLRTHPAVVHWVSEGPSDKGRSNRFQVVEVPDDVEWSIKASHAREQIVEKHRTWP